MYVIGLSTVWMVDGARGSGAALEVCSTCHLEFSAWRWTFADNVAAAALTRHKSPGLTRDVLTVDLGDGACAEGRMDVARSQAFTIGEFTLARRTFMFAGL